MRSARLLLLIGIAAAMAACSPRPPAQLASPRPSPRGRGPWLHITGSGTARQPIRFVATSRDNRKEYDLVARSYESNGAQGASIATFSIVHVTFYGKGGALVSNAAKAIVDEAANTITLAENVHARSNSGMTLTCDTLRYDRTTQMVHGEGHVVMTNAQGMRATGNSVDTDITLTRARMQ